MKNVFDVKPSEITNKDFFLNRRRFLSVACALSGLAFTSPKPLSATTPIRETNGIKKTPWGSSLDTTSFEAITSYNNFYEFGTDKSDPKKNAHTLRPKPWTIKVTGHAENIGTFDYEDLIKRQLLEERIYRMRCVEGWSMVIPWMGIPLATIIKVFRPTVKARYVGFESLYDTIQMPLQKSPILDWPYVEGLRLDEATHPLTILAVGIYGEDLPNQNGAPLRLVVPWKYGFKGLKSIVKISFTEKQPPSTWNMQAPSEYGFYSNVNPEVDHPRWSQRRERRITGEGGLSALFAKKTDTLMFNGYAEEVAHLYTGMDLKQNF